MLDIGLEYWTESIFGELVDAGLIMMKHMRRIGILVFRFFSFFYVLSNPYKHIVTNDLTTNKKRGQKVK